MKRRKKRHPLIQVVIPTRSLAQVAPAGQSEVARLRQQLQVEWESAQLGLSGLAQVAQHQFITAKMERMGEIHEQIKDLVGTEESVQIVAEVMEKKKKGEGP